MAGNFVSDREDTREHADALNRTASRDAGVITADLDWQNNQAGYILTILNTNASGNAIAILLPATLLTATPSAANSAVLLNASGVQIGAGKALKLWNAAGTFGISMDGTAATADRAVVLQDLAGTMALLGAQNVGNLLFVDATYDIGASGATRPRDLFLSRNGVIGGTLGVTGTATMAAIAASGAVSITVAGLGLAVTNNATVGGTLGVTGTLTASNALGVGGLLSANGGQIAFPATQNPSAGANVLDDYEEGTWTPSIGGTATYTTQDGRYTKVGRVLHVSARLTINNIGVGASVSTISGLPFSVATNGVMGIATHYWAGSATNYVHIAGLISGTTIILQSATAAAAALTTSTFFASAADICLSGFYIIN